MPSTGPLDSLLPACPAPSLSILTFPKAQALYIFGGLLFLDVVSHDVDLHSSSCLCLPRAGITGGYHRAWPHTLELFSFICVGVNVCVCRHKYVHVCVQVYECICVCRHKCVYVCANINVCVDTNVCMCVYRHKCVYVPFLRSCPP